MNWIGCAALAALAAVMGLGIYAAWAVDHGDAFEVDE